MDAQTEVTLAKMSATVDMCQYKDWDFTLQHVENPTAYDQWGTVYLTAMWIDETGKLQKSRRWMMSQHMTHSEIVQTVFKCVVTAEEHELRERFRYQSHAIFCPHYDVDALLALCEKEAMDRRVDVR